METRKLIYEQESYGEITDIISSQNLADTEISLFDNMSNQVRTTNSD
jgi:hypothetical protein